MEEIKNLMNLSEYEYLAFNPFLDFNPFLPVLLLLKSC